MKTGLAVALAAAPLLLAAAAPGSETSEQTALLGSRVTLTQAIATAEQQTGGKAYDAGVDAGHGALRIVVETNGPNGVQTVMLDAHTGRILGRHAGGEAD